VPTVLFDEIDAGVGGEVGDTVGRLLREVGQRFQVLAVTHLPQVAACAQHHWRVSKDTAQGRTLSRVAVLPADERTAEVARMLGGAGTPGDTRLAHAQALLSAAGAVRRGNA
jgi:DNA repair protein RecN (Recombination protein N)